MRPWELLAAELALEIHSANMRPVKTEGSKLGADIRTTPRGGSLAKGASPRSIPPCRHGGTSGQPGPDTSGEELRPIHPPLCAHERRL